MPRTRETLSLGPKTGHFLLLMYACITDVSCMHVCGYGIILTHTPHTIPYSFHTIKLLKHFILLLSVYKIKYNNFWLFSLISIKHALLFMGILPLQSTDVASINSNGGAQYWLLSFNLLAQNQRWSSYKQATTARRDVRCLTDNQPTRADAIKAGAGVDLPCK